MASGRNKSTMNRPDASALNSGADATVASQVFVKRQAEGGEVPAIATGFIPPVVEDKPASSDKKSASPFKTYREPVKRPKNAANGSSQQQKKTEPLKEDEPAGPQIARFVEIPVIEKPASPFVPIGEKPKTVNGMKAPIKRPPSASVNHAQAKKDEEEKEKIRRELNAMGGISAARENRAQGAATGRKPSPFNKGKTIEKETAPEPQIKKDEPLKTSDKTFVPLAPIPFYAEKKEEINPFAAPVKKTEAQLRQEEENRRRALEQSRISEKKQSRFGKFIDDLNKPLF